MANRISLQFGAMFMKNVAFMRRKTCQLVLLALSPIIFCLIITLIQYFFDVRVGSDVNFQCGCKCLACTVDDPNNTFGNHSKYIQVPRGIEYNPCPTNTKNCFLTDQNDCGLKYSGGSGQQLAFCSVPQPSSWPALLQVTAPQITPQFVVSHTNRTLGRELSGKFFHQGIAEARVQRQYMQNYLNTTTSQNFGQLCEAIIQGSPNSTIPNNTELQNFFIAKSIDYLQRSNQGVRETFYGELLSLQDQTFGTVQGPATTLLVDPAFVAQIFGTDKTWIQKFVGACDASQISCSYLIQHDYQQSLAQQVKGQQQSLRNEQNLNGSTDLATLLLGFGGLLTDLGSNVTTVPDLLVLNDTANQLIPKNNYFELSPAVTAIAMQIPALLELPNGNIALKNLPLGQDSDTLANAIMACQQPVGARQIAYKSSTEELNRQLYCGFEQVYCESTKSPGTNLRYSNAWDFLNTSVSQGNYGLNADMYINETITNQLGSVFSAPTIRRLQQPLNLAAQAFLQTILGPDYQLNLEAIMDAPTIGRPFTIDISSVIGTLFFQLLFQLTFVLMVQQLVYEKERRLRNMMRMHGLSDVTYWGVNFIFYTVMNIVYFAFIIIFGSFISGVDLQVELITKKKISSRLVGLEFFRQNNYGVQIIFYVLFSLLQTSFACFLSTLYSKQTTAVAGSFVYIFGNVLLAGVLIDNLIQQSRWWVVFLEVIPPFALYRGIFELSSYSNRGVTQGSEGMTFHDVANYRVNGMLWVWIIFIAETIVFLVLSFYFDQILNTGAGVKKHPLFFLGFAYKVKMQDITSELQENKAVHEDVVAESKRVKNLDMENMGGDAMIVKSLQKVYPSRGYGTKSKVAVKNLDLGILKGECFGLLGPNGAGKSTTISMMIGYIQPTQGSISLAGLNLGKQLHEAYQSMGVCPQDNCLWEGLTGREHLLFYGRLKGFSGKKLDTAVNDALKTVNLYYGRNGDKLTSTYSGGMKRRLSVAISFMGNPAIVFLDEPSTGLDPASRRQLWQAVKKRKGDRGILLTTHSMQEAEILCDRIGIFVDGQLVVIGDPKRIRQKFGNYLIFQIIVPQDQQIAAKEMVRKQFPKAELTYSINGTFKYDMPANEYAVSDIFKYMQSVKRRGNIKILDWDVHNASLEDVFIKVSREAGAVMSERQ